MGWQDSFIPDSGTTQAPPAVQAQGWQSSFVPDGQQQTTPANPNSFIDNPTLKNLGNSAVEALGDTARGPVNSLVHLSKMVYGENPWTNAGENRAPIITDKVGETANNLASVLMPFAAVPEGSSEKLAAPDVEESTVTPTSGDIKLIKEKLDLAGITPQQYADALMKSSPDDFAGELGGDPLRMQTQAQAKVTGPAMQEARDAMRARMAAAPQRTAEIIGENIKPAENVSNMLQNIEAMKDQAAPLYQEAFQQTVPLSEFSDVINTPAGQTALQKTAIDFANSNKSPQQMGLSLGEDGKYSLNENIPIETMHQIQRNIGDQVERDPFGNATSSPGNQVLEKQQSGITSKLGSLNPAYQKALNVSAAYKQAENAFSMGRQLAKSAAGEKADSIMQLAADKMSPNELSYQRAGYAQGLTDSSMGAPLGTGSPASRIATGKVQNSVASILDNPTQAQKFADMLMQEKNRVDLAQRGLGGSNTAETLTSGVPEIPTSIHGIAATSLNAIKDFLQAGKNERLAQLLYATDPETKSILAQKVLGK
jgi:hypothetical protein